MTDREKLLDIRNQINEHFSQDEPEPQPEGNQVNIDGIIYDTVKIGSQRWLADNLRNTFDIPVINDPRKWTDRTDPACAVYGDEKIYGKLYNFYALSAFRPPKGWRVATDADWKELERHLGADRINDFGHRGDNQDVGAKLKSTDHFRDPISDPSHKYYNPDFRPATNETGFSAVPNGSLNPIDKTHSGAGFYSLLRDADFWTSTDHSGRGIVRAISFNRTGIFRGVRDKKFGMAVRLVKNDS